MSSRTVHFFNVSEKIPKHLSIFTQQKTRAKTERFAPLCFCSFLSAVFTVF